MQRIFIKSDKGIVVTDKNAKILSVQNDHDKGLIGQTIQHIVNTNQAIFQKLPFGIGE